MGTAVCREVSGGLVGVGCAVGTGVAVVAGFAVGWVGPGGVVGVGCAPLAGLDVAVGSGLAVGDGEPHEADSMPSKATPSIATASLRYRFVANTSMKSNVRTAGNISHFFIIPFPSSEILRRRTGSITQDEGGCHFVPGPSFVRQVQNPICLTLPLPRKSWMRLPKVRCGVWRAGVPSIVSNGFPRAPACLPTGGNDGPRKADWEPNTQFCASLSFVSSP